MNEQKKYIYRKIQLENKKDMRKKEKEANMFLCNWKYYEIKQKRKASSNNFCKESTL